MGLVWLVGINVRTYRWFADDKARAVKGRRRIPEHALLNLASMGGSVGAMLAQRRLRHKTLKEPFVSQLRRIVLTQAALLVIIALAVLLLATPVSAAGFACANPRHHDGDAIRCDGGGRSMRLYGIDAPEMPGACRPGRQCTPGDPFAARDYLQALTARRSVMCEQVDTDDYGRQVVRCSADGADLSCAMVAGGQAVERYGRLGCGDRASDRSAAQPPSLEDQLSASAPAERQYAAASARVTEGTAATTRLHVVLSIGAWLLAVNAATYAAFAMDKRRALASANRKAARIPESCLLGLAAMGGSPAAILARRRLRHKIRKQPFGERLLAILAVQLFVLATAIYLGFRATA